MTTETLIFIIYSINIPKGKPILFHSVRDERDIGLFITLVPKVSKKRFLIRWLNKFRDFYYNLIGRFIKLNVQIFQPLIVLIIRVNFVYNHW